MYKLFILFFLNCLLTESMLLLKVVTGNFPTSCIHTDKWVQTNKMGRSRKYPYHTMDGLSEFRGQEGVLWTGNPKTWGDTYDWNSEGMGGFYIWDFHRRQSRVYSLKKLILWTFKISSQIKHELMTLLTIAEAGYKTSIDRSDMFVFICRRKPTKRGLYIKLHGPWRWWISYQINKIWKIYVSHRLYISCTPVEWTAKTRVREMAHYWQLFFDAI